MTAINFHPLSGFLPWQPAACLQVGGSDAFTFLQGQFTNDLNLVSRGAVYGLWLTLKGKVLGDSFVVPGISANDYRVVSYLTEGRVLIERLESYIIADDVTVDDETLRWRAVSLFSPETSALVPPGALGGIVFPGRRSSLASVEWVFPIAVEAEAKQVLAGATELNNAVVEAARISSGIPSVPVDIGPNDLPNEGGLERDAISYTKGCYLGQEVMARLKTMGQVRRRLLRVRGTGPAPARGSALFAGGKQIGELRSVAAQGADGFVGLAMISLINLGGHTTLSANVDEPAEIQLVDSP